MPETLLDRLGEALRRQQLNLLATFLSHNLRRFLMSLGILDGFKTYIVAVAMVVAALSQLVGVDLPSFDGHSAGQLLMEGLAILFLRKGIKG
jgi:hypothetical protein